MFKRILFALAAVLFMANASFADLTTFELVGSVKSADHNAVVKSVKNALGKDFEVIGTTNPANDKKLTVLILESKPYFDAADSAGKYAFFAIPLRVGIKMEGGDNKVMFVDPDYLAAAFANTKSKFVKAAKNAKSMLEADLAKVANLKAAKKGFGYETDVEEISEWEMMGKSKYTMNKIGNKKFASNAEAIKAINAALSKKANGWSKVYEIDLKNAAVIGVSNPKFEKEAFEIGGSDHLCAFPIEIVVTNNEALVLPEMYRMSLYFMDAGMAAFSAHMSMPGEIDKSLNSLLK
jgi:hypothetical protein